MLVPRLSECISQCSLSAIDTFDKRLTTYRFLRLNYFLCVTDLECQKAQKATFSQTRIRMANFATKCANSISKTQR